MAICMVERNVVGVSAIFSISAARLSPASASRRSLFSFREMRAISVAAKMALMAMKTNCSSI